LEQINSIIITNDTNNSGIYLIINLQNNKFYVGSSVNVKKRKNKHLQQLRKNNHDNSYLQYSFNKYGESNFVFTLIEDVPDKNNLIIREQYWIDTLDACNKNIAYNILPKANSMLGYKHGSKSTEKHRQAGLNLSPESRQKIAESKYKSVIQLTLEGQFVKKWISIKEICDTLEFDQPHISTCCANKNNVKQHKGFIWVWEYNYKDFDINNYKRPYKNNKGKITLQYDLDGNFIKEWLNAKTASRELGLEYISITECCTGRIKKSQGFIWKYAS